MLKPRASIVKAGRQVATNSQRLCWPREAADMILSQLRQDCSFLFFAARSEAAVVPPPTLVRLSESRMPCVGIGARLALMVRELTPIQEISEDSRPYSIFGQRFITTFNPLASASAAAASLRMPSCIHTTRGRGCIFSTSSTIGSAYGDARNI